MWLRGKKEIAIRSGDGTVTSATIAAVDRPKDIAILTSSAAAGNLGFQLRRGVRVSALGYLLFALAQPNLMGLLKNAWGTCVSFAPIDEQPRCLKMLQRPCKRATAAAR